MSRFIDLCLSALPARCHWDKTTHGAFISELEALNADPLGTGVPMKELVNFGFFAASFDVDNGYTQVTEESKQGVAKHGCGRGRDHRSMQRARNLQTPHGVKRLREPGFKLFWMMWSQC